MLVNRSVNRDVHIYNAKGPNTILGGLQLARGVHKCTFPRHDRILEMFYNLQGECETVIQRHDRPLRLGKYFIVAEGSVTISDEPWLVRTTYLSCDRISYRFLS